MKAAGLHIVIFVLAIVFYSCEKPLPTELYSDPEEQQGNIEIEVLSGDPESPVVDYTYDTTGVFAPFHKASTVVLYNNIKNTSKGKTSEVTTARAYFYDKSSPIKSKGRILGYATKASGLVKFGGKIARLDKNILKYKDKGIIKDTVTGPFYHLKKWDGHGDDIAYEFGSKLQFTVEGQGNRDYQQDIYTPAEITGKVEINTSSDNVKRFLLTWNKADGGRIEIIIGGLKKEGILLPLFRLKTDDDGSLVLPQTLLAKIPAAVFERVSFLFIRKVEQSYNTNSVVKDIYFASQSIHSIQVEIK